jgi:hypothetical protein
MVDIPNESTRVDLYQTVVRGGGSGTGGADFKT